jgi:predicted nucleic acid-binding Zn ribbon protein
MNEQISSKEIIQKYPELFGEPPFDLQKTLIGFGFECSPYWYPILEKGFQKISKIVKDNNYKDFRIVQVKEKFGMLEIYAQSYYKEINEVINNMRKECVTICENCGAPGKLRTNGWFAVLCDKCFYERYGYNEGDENGNKM